MNEVYTFFRIAALFVGLAFLILLLFFILEQWVFKDWSVCFYKSELDFRRYASIEQQEFCEKSAMAEKSISVYVAAVVTYLITIKKKKRFPLKKKHV
ncbi:hypothetical protein KA078_02675 [Candidatus Woesebacteria bacterium]|nr:hypothetical protein [Candidatus Woesebacteria bacterium]